MKNAIKNKPYHAVWEKARKDAKHLTAHITGQGKDELLERITGLENEDQLKLRKKYARSNKDIFARIHRPEDKVFTAKGGSNYYNLSESLTKDFIARLQNVYNGFSVRSWTENVAKQYYHIDPMGLVFMEIGDNITYPTYKSTQFIHDGQPKGRDLEYIIFTIPERPTFYRVVDDAYDYTVKFENDVVTVIQDETYTNFYGKVPAKILSDILAMNSELMASPDAEIIELADEFLRESSVKSVYKLKHGFPKAWQYASTCKVCSGTGFYESKICKTCNGSTYAVNKDASEIMAIPVPNEGQPTITPNVAGYISPDIAGWDKMTEELVFIGSWMHQTYWGTDTTPRTKGTGLDSGGTPTATEVMDDKQPEIARLTKISLWAESIETWVTDMSGSFYYGATYKGCSVNLGRRYQIESPDALWAKYQDARTKGSSIAVLDEQLTEYYCSKFASNSMDLHKSLKLMKVEPFIHMTIGEAKNNVSNFDDYNKKLYFSEWLNQLGENDIMIKSVSDLVKSLSEYVKEKAIEKPDPKPII